MKTALFLALAGFLIAGALPGAVESGTFVTIPSAVPVSPPLVELNGQLSARLVVALATGFKSSDLEAHTDAVYSDKAQSDQLTSLIDVHLLPDRENPKNGVLVYNAAALALPVDTYTVIAAITSKLAPSEPAQFLAIKLVRPAAALKVLEESVILWSESWPWGLNRSTFTLHLRETDRKAALHGLTVTDVRKASKEPSDTGLLKLTPSSTTIAAGAEGQIAISLEGDFPPGTTEGKLHLRSPQLSVGGKDTVEMDYKIQSIVRPAAFWIPLCVLAGALIGWLVRIALDRQRKLLAARIKASTAREALNAALATSVDKLLTSALNNALTALDDALRSGDTTKIEVAAESAQTARNNAEAELKQRHRDLIKEATDILAVLQVGWQVPPAVQMNVAAAQPFVQGIIDLASTLNVEEAREQFNAARGARLDAVANECHLWSKGAAAYLAEAAANLPPRVAADDATLTSALTACQATCAASTIPHSVTLDDLKQRLISVEGTYATANDIARDIGRSTRSLVSWATETLAVAGRGLLAPLARVTEGAERDMLLDLESPGTALDAPEERLKHQKQTWSATLCSLIAKAKPEDVQKVVSAIDATDWKGAVETTLKLWLTAPDRDVRLSQGQTTTTAPVPLPAAGSRQHVARQFSGVVAAATALLHPLPKVVGTLSERLEMERAARAMSWAQVLVLALIVMAVATSYYDDHWTGAWTQLLTVFVGAFTLNFTADSLLGVVNTIGSAVSNGWRVPTIRA